MQTLDKLLTQSSEMSKEQAYVSHAVACSPFVARLFTKDSALMHELLAKVHQAFLLSDMQDFLALQNISDEVSLKRALRLLRQHVMARMIVRDLNGLADLQEVMRTTSQLAECAINTAIGFIHSWQAETYGQPLDAQGNPEFNRDRHG